MAKSMRKSSGVRFLPVVDLWAVGVQPALLSGQLRLQRGQWVRCGDERPSRFIGLSEQGVIFAVHPLGDGKAAGKGRFVEVSQALADRCV